MSTRKRSLQLLAFMLVASVLIIAGSRAKAGSIGGVLPPQMPGPDAQQLWKYITKENPYKSWKTFPDLAGRFVHVNESPHGDWIAVYFNAEAYESITTSSNPFQMRYGSIVVKENYSLAKGDPSPQPQLASVPVSLTSLTVMYKIKGYQRVPGEQEWFWVMYGCQAGECDGTVATISNQAFVNEQIPKSNDTYAFFQGEVVAGKPWICIECHQRASQANDFAIGDYLWKLKPFAPK